MSGSLTRAHLWLCFCAMTQVNPSHQKPQVRIPSWQDLYTWMSSQPLKSNLLKLNLQTTLTPLPVSSPRLAVLVASASSWQPGSKTAPFPSNSLYTSCPTDRKPCQCPSLNLISCSRVKTSCQFPPLTLASQSIFHASDRLISSHNPKHIMTLSCLISSLLVACCSAKSLTQFSNVNVEKNHSSGFKCMAPLPPSPGTSNAVVVDRH